MYIAKLQVWQRPPFLSPEVPKLLSCGSSKIQGNQSLELLNPQPKNPNDQYNVKVVALLGSYTCKKKFGNNWPSLQDHSIHSRVLSPSSGAQIWKGLLSGKTTEPYTGCTTKLRCRVVWGNRNQAVVQCQAMEQSHKKAAMVQSRKHCDCSDRFFLNVEIQPASQDPETHSQPFLRELHLKRQC